jgi:hypothetical protein
VSTISILLKQEDERVICSFSCVNIIMPNLNIVGEGYMGVTQSVFTLENTNLLREYIKEKKSIIGFESSIPDHRQYGFLFNGYFRLNANGENGVFGYRVNGSNRTYVEFVAPTATAYASPSITAIFNLSVSDYVDVRWSGSGDYYGGNEECNFYGWLIG